MAPDVASSIPLPNEGRVASAPHGGADNAGFLSRITDGLSQLGQITKKIIVEGCAACTGMCPGCKMAELAQEAMKLSPEQQAAANAATRAVQARETNQVDKLQAVHSSESGAILSKDGGLAHLLQGLDSIAAVGRGHDALGARGASHGPNGSAANGVASAQHGVHAGGVSAVASPHSPLVPALGQHLPRNTRAGEGGAASHQEARGPHGAASRSATGIKADEPRASSTPKGNVNPAPITSTSRDVKLVSPSQGAKLDTVQVASKRGVETGRSLVQPPQGAIARELKQAIRLDESMRALAGTLKAAINLTPRSETSRENRVAPVARALDKRAEVQKEVITPTRSHRLASSDRTVVRQIDRVIRLVHQSPSPRPALRAATSMLAMARKVILSGAPAAQKQIALRAVAHTLSRARVNVQRSIVRTRNRAEKSLSHSVRVSRVKSVRAAAFQVRLREIRQRVDRLKVRFKAAARAARGQSTRMVRRNLGRKSGGMIRTSYRRSAATRNPGRIARTRKGSMLTRSRVNRKLERSPRSGNRPQGRRRASAVSTRTSSQLRGGQRRLGERKRSIGSTSRSRATETRSTRRSSRRVESRRRESSQVASLRREVRSLKRLLNSLSSRLQPQSLQPTKARVGGVEDELDPRVTLNVRDLRRALKRKKLSASQQRKLERELAKKKREGKAGQGRGAPAVSSSKSKSKDGKGGTPAAPPSGDAEQQTQAKMLNIFQMKSDDSPPPEDEGDYFQPGA